jgi:hypothetical protein
MLELDNSVQDVVAVAPDSELVPDLKSSISTTLLKLNSTCVFLIRFSLSLMRCSVLYDTRRSVTEAGRNMNMASSGPR